MPLFIYILLGILVTAAISYAINRLSTGHTVTAGTVLLLAALVVFGALIEYKKDTTNTTTSSPPPTQQYTPAQTDSSTPPPSEQPTTVDTTADTTSDAPSTTDQSSSADTSTESTTPTYATAPATPARISIGTLCNAPGADSYICGTQFGATAQIGNQLFEYHGQSNGFATPHPPYWDSVLSFPATTCTKLTLQFGMDDRTSRIGEVANLRVIQSGAAPVVASATHGTLKTFTVSLNGGPFSVDAQSTNDSQIFFDGYGICTSETGE